MKDEPSVTEAQVEAALVVWMAGEKVIDETSLAYHQREERLRPIMRAALSAAALSQPKPGEVGELRGIMEIGGEIANRRWLDTFEKSALAKDIADALSTQQSRIAALQAEVDRLTAERDDERNRAQLNRQYLSDAQHRNGVLYGRLATIEKETAERCAGIARGLVYQFPKGRAGDLIRQHHGCEIADAITREFSLPARASLPTEEYA